ncbi:hypothetical protein ACFX13_038056 [Malus domestica]
MDARTISIIFAMLVLGCHSVSATIFRKIHIDVENRVLPKADVELHRKSKNDDLGSHVIPPSGADNFTFNDNLWDTTLFYCYMQWKRPDGKWVKGAFKIYEPKRDLRHCMHRCKWQIHAKSIFSFTLDTKRWKNLYKDFTIEDRASSPNNAPPSAYSSFVFITLVVHSLFIV